MMKNQISYQDSIKYRELKKKENAYFLRKMTFERITLFAPSTIVCLIAKITGNLDIGQLTISLEKIQRKHPLTKSKVVFDKDENAWFSNTGVGKIPLKEYSLENENDWMKILHQEYREPFKFEQGPLLRVIVVKGIAHFDLILFSHHAICDGRSLTIMLRDLLQFLECPDQVVVPMDELPLIEPENLPTPLKNDRILRFIASKMNMRWEKYKMRFTQADYEEIHKTFWQEQNHFIAMSLNRDQTVKVVEWCKSKKVKVHSLLCTTFYRAQSELQPFQPYLKNLIMPLDVRSRLKQPVGEVFGFYATAAIIPLLYKFNKTFEQNVLRFHKKILKELKQGDPFKTLKFDFLSPTLIDALYFEKSGYIHNPVAQILSKIIKWDRMTTGMMISNLGNLSIPSSYGKYHIEQVFAPSVITSRHQKYLGIATINGRLNFLMTSRNSCIPNDLVLNLCDRAKEILLRTISN